jgi:hypothetical protein
MKQQQHQINPLLRRSSQQGVYTQQINFFFGSNEPVNIYTMENESKCNKKSVWEGSGTNKTNIRYYYETATAPE